MKEALGVLARGTLRLWSQNVFCWGLLTSGIWHVSVEAVCGAKDSEKPLVPKPGCTDTNMAFGDVSSCEPEFDATAIAQNPGLEDRTVCLGLSPYYGFTFAPVGRGPAEWIAKRVSVGTGAHGSVSCGGAVTVNDACTALVATYEGPARNPAAANRQTVTLAGDPQYTFTLTGLQGILYSGQGVRLTGYRRDGGSVSTVLAPSELLNPVFPPQQWSGLVTLEFVPDVGNSGWAFPDEFATLKIFWLNATVC